jgi:hypothetical protein
LSENNENETSQKRPAQVCRSFYYLRVRRALLILAFQQKLFLPTLSLALGIGVAGYFMVWSTPIVEGTGYGYIVAGPVVHYFAYEVTYKKDYYF